MESKQKQGASIKFEEEEDGMQSAEFGFVHPSIHNLSDKNLALNNKKMKINGSETSLVSDYSNTTDNNLIRRVTRKGAYEDVRGSIVEVESK